MPSVKVTQVMRGFLSLDTDEQREVVEAIRKYQQGGSFRESVRKSFRGGATRLETGPMSNGCPCCGR